jgi:hypothetical protein
MTSHHHHPGSAGGAAPGSQPTHPGNATRRAAAVTRHAPATSQAGRSASPGRDMDARSARPRRAQHSPAASLRSALRRQTASARPRSRTAAQSVIETPERPAPRPAINPGRPLTLSQLPHLLQHTALVYGLARVWTNGTIGNGSTAKALRWRHADRLNADLTPGPIIVRPCPRRRIGVHQDLRLTIPAAARRSYGIKTGDHVLLAAAPAHRLLIIHTIRAVDELLTVLDAALSAASPAASAIVSSAAARGKGQAMNRPEDLAVPPPGSKGGAS